MKFYNSVGPNPRMVRMFMAERGAVAKLVKVDTRGGENLREPYLKKNPAGLMPTLELDDGTCLSEITAICEYVDETTPGLSLIGATPVERAETRMLVRRVDLNIVEPMLNGFRWSKGLSYFEGRMRCIPEAAEPLKQTARDKLAWVDGLIKGRTFLCGDRFSMADIFLFAFLDFGFKIDQPFDPELSTIPTWYATMAARPSAKA